MVPRFWLATAVLGFSLMSMWGASQVAADPIWNIVETSCTSNPEGCQEPLNLPLTLGTIEGSGTYTNAPFGEFSESGNFSATFFDAPIGLSSSSPAYCPFDDVTCHVNIDVGDSPEGMFGSYEVATPGDQTQVNLVFTGTTFSGLWGSDNVLAGCGAFAGCTISGVLVSTPEPSSLADFLTTIGLIGVLLFFGRRRAI